MKTSFLMLLLWGIFTKSYLFGQARFYIQIPDQKDVPKISQINATNEYIVESGEYTTDRVFAKYRIMKFQKAFPHSKTKYLQEIYEINCNDIALMNELRNSLSDKYPYLQEIPSDELCILPNDYDYSGGFPGDQSFLTHIRAEEAWDITHGDPNIPIGITDTHFETTHEDLQNKIIQVYGSNYLPDNYDDNEDLLHFWEHGTVTSGTMAAETNNGLGLSSIGYNCSIVASSNWANYDELIMLSQQGVRVINASWGHYDVYIPAQQAAIDEIYDNGTLIVAAAGNDTVTNYFYPASYNHVFSVAIIGHRNEPGYQDPILGPFNWKDRVELYVGDPSHVSTHNDSVDLCAPGWQITSCRLNNSYADLYANGTSVSAPLVTGTCGLMLSINPCLTNDDFV